MAEEKQEVALEETTTAKAEKSAPKSATTVTENGTITFAEPPADFDWDALDETGESTASADREKLEKAYEDTLSSISEKEVLMGKVVGMNKKEVVINIGYKSEGVVPLSEFRYKPDLAIGDEDRACDLFCINSFELFFILELKLLIV